jgi:hypothetical protein
MLKLLAQLCILLETPRWVPNVIEQILGSLLGEE